jgi:hypothetical protein
MGRHAWVLALTALLSGCGSNAAEEAETPADSAASVEAVDSTASSGAKACDVVSAAELARFTGLQLEEGRLTNDYGGVSQCRWSRVGGTDNGVTVSVREDGDLENYRGVPGAVAVSGVGEEAVWNPRSHQMAFRVGRRTASITFLYDDGRESQAREIAAVIQRALAAATP